MREKTVFFTFAGTTIHIVFTPPSFDLFLHNRLIADIHTFFSPYLSKGSGHSASSTLFITERARPASYKEYVTKKRLQIDLFKERKKSEYETYYDIGILQFHSVLFHLLFKELIHDGTIFTLHGSAVETERGAVLFVGNTGTGKSTMVNKLKNRFRPLADDQICVKKDGDKIHILQLPFFEKTFAIEKRSEPVPFYRLYFLQKHARFLISPITEFTGYRLLMPHITFNDGSLAMWRFLSLPHTFFHLHTANSMPHLTQLIEHINDFPNSNA